VKRRKRRRLLEQPFPEAWHAGLSGRVFWYPVLPKQQKSKLQAHLCVLVSEKNWEGCGGLEMSEEIQVVVAAQAALLLIGLERHDFFPQVMSILVYPNNFMVRREWVDEAGLVHETDAKQDGEAWYRGPVVLGWKEVLEDAAQPGTGVNVVLHEFAHQLDFEDGGINGTPRLRSPEDYPRWQEVMSDAFERLARDADRGRDTLLDPYGAESPEEFFAVATESFFDDPSSLYRREPDLYAVLQRYYGQDPRLWFPPGGGESGDNRNRQK
jgi:Mlc titration factor MtfA (ptsG expression regulator)